MTTDPLPVDQNGGWIVPCPDCLTPMVVVSLSDEWWCQHCDRVVIADLEDEDECND